jgi:hypothetical protein
VDDSNTSESRVGEARCHMVSRVLRRFFVVDESRLRVHLYLHEGLDLDAANAFWSDVTSIPIE